MSTESITSVIACVIILASVQARQPKVDLERFKTEDTTGDVTHVIYPRTGRLFHADYLRDNQIFRSLERTNFMRRGPFSKGVSLKRPKRDIEEIVPKKHVYVGTARIPGVETKKEVLVREKDIPSKAVLVKVSSDDHKVEKRYKREIVKEGLSVPEITNSGQSHIEQTTPTVKQENTLEKNIEKISQDDLDEFNNQMSFENEITPVTEEKTVQEDNAPVVKNNDTDKTLLLRDNKKEPAEAFVKIPEVDVGSDGQMRKTILDDSLNLYPVYRGVKYYYPLSERRLVYSPQLTVQMDMPVVSEDVQVRSAQNSTDKLQEEGRSRRPLKRLAFPLLLALKLKTAIMLPLILGLISLISFKGLWSGLTALAIAAALGLKALMGSGTRVVVQPPILPPSPHHHSHHFPPHDFVEYWSRKGEEYSDYRPNSWS